MPTAGRLIFLKRGFSSLRQRFADLGRTFAPMDLPKLKALLAAHQTAEVRLEFGALFSFYRQHSSHLDVETRVRLRTANLASCTTGDGLLILLQTLTSERALLFEREKAAAAAAFQRVFSKLAFAQLRIVLNLMAELRVPLRVQEMRPALQAKLAQEEPRSVFEMLFAAGMVDTPLLYILKSHHSSEALFGGHSKARSLELLLSTGVVLDKELMAHFALAPAEPAMPSAKSYSALMREYEGIALDQAMDFYRKVKNEPWTQPGFPRQFFSAVTERHLSRIRRVPRLALAAVEVLLPLAEAKLLEELLPPLRVLGDELGNIFFATDRPEALFHQQIFIFERLFEAIAAVENPPKQSKSIKEFLRACCDMLDKFLARTLFTEDVHGSIAAGDKNSPAETTDASTVLVMADIQLKDKDLDVLFRVFSICADKNIGTVALFEKLCSCFAKFATQMQERHLAALLYHLAQVNVPSADIDSALLSCLGECTPTKELILPAAFYMAVRAEKPDAKWLRPLATRVAEASREDRMIAFFIQEIEKARRGALNTEAPPIEPFPELFAASDFSSEIEFFLSHIHLQDLENRPARLPVTAHFGQKDKVLVCLDYDMCSLDSERPRGLAALALRFLETRCDSVSSVLKTSFDGCETRNLRMHHLLQNIRKWKIDYDERERQMNLAYEKLEAPEAR